MSKKSKMFKKRNDIQICRTKEQRSDEARKIINKLTELNITTEYESIKELLKMLSIYIKYGERLEVNISFPELGRIIKGVLATNINEEVWVMLTNS